MQVDKTNTVQGNQKNNFYRDRQRTGKNIKDSRWWRELKDSQKWHKQVGQRTRIKENFPKDGGRQQSVNTNLQKMAERQDTQE